MNSEQIGTTQKSIYVKSVNVCFVVIYFKPVQSASVIEFYKKKMTEQHIMLFLL